MRALHFGMQGFRHTLGLWLVVFVFGSVAVEIVWYLVMQRRSYPWRETFASLGVAMLRIPSRLLAGLIVGPVAFFCWSHRLTTIPLDTAWGLALLFLGEEFSYYWSHRAGHEVRWMWASHVVHHTPERIHLGSAFRLSATEVFSGGWLFRVPLFLLGLNPVAVGGMFAINLLYQLWLHTDIVGRLGPIEWISNTPAHHRVHHASNSEYLDRNYGGILIVWDRLFGTFANEQPDTKTVYGLVHPIGSLNPITILFHEWGALARDVFYATSLRQRLALMFGRPGNSLAREDHAPTPHVVAAE